MCNLTPEHQCDFPGCENVLVLDGNTKNRRDVCNAKDAGYISYPGLPGHIKTGCTASPAFKSRFCSEHSSRTCITDDSNMQEGRYLEVIAGEIFCNVGLDNNNYCEC